MLFLVFLITAFVPVICQDLLGVSYYFDENYTDTFSEKQCVNTTQWGFVSYGHLELMPPYEKRSSGIRALRNSCTTSFPIMFFNGTLEVVVYIRTISKYSGITISVFDEDEYIASVRYQRANKNFVPGWVIVSLPIKNRTTGYVQISGQSLNSELVIVDSLRYEPDNSAYSQSKEEIQMVINNQKNNTQPPNYFHNEFIFAFDGSGDSDIGEEGSGEIDISEEGSGEIETELSTEDPDAQTEDPDNPETDNSREEPSTEEDRLNSEDDEFWNVFTITLVSVGAFTAVGLVGVGSYFLGMNKGISRNPPLDLEALEAPSEVIPRVRSVFSDATYNSRYTSR